MSEAEIGSVYLKLEKTKCKLRKREHDGELIVKNLRVLADCFDPDKQNSEVQKYEDDRMSVWDEGAKVIEFPLEAEQIAKDICDLKEARAELEKRLRVLVGCA